MNSGTHFWFSSSLFDAELSEDEETNPRMYGRQVARWLRERLLALGYPVEEVFGEDWGWCVMCQREPYSMWVACVNLRDYEYVKEGDPPPTKEQLLWSAVSMAEVPFFKYLLRPKSFVSERLAKLDVQLRIILEAEPNIRLVEEAAANSWFRDHGYGA